PGAGETLFLGIRRPAADGWMLARCRAGRAHARPRAFTGGLGRNPRRTAAASDELVSHDGLLATGTDPDGRHPGHGQLLDPLHVALRVGRQILERAAARDVLLPAGH